MEFEYSDIFVQDMYILYFGTMDVQAQLSKSMLQKGWKTSCWGTASGEGNQGGHLGRWVSTSGFDENSWDSSTAVYLGP